MKKSLSILLALAMGLGICVSGMVGAGAADYYDGYWSNLLLAVEFIYPAEAYEFFRASGNPVIEAEIKRWPCKAS